MENTPSLTKTEWDDVNVQEMAKFLSITMLMGVLKAPEKFMYWQTNRKWHVPAISLCMTSKRYAQIDRYLHTHNNKSFPLTTLIG